MAAVCVSTLTATAQTLKTGKSGVLGDTGTATYSYFEQQGKQVWQGPYTYEKTTAGGKIIERGAYENDKRTGVWTADATDSQTGTTFHSEMTYQDGLLEGTFKSVLTQEGKEPVETVFNFLHGNIVGDSCVLVRPQHTYVFSYDADGMPHGKWVMGNTQDFSHSSQLVEVFDHGMITEMYELDPVSGTQKYSAIMIDAMLDDFIMDMVGCIGENRKSLDRALEHKGPGCAHTFGWVAY